MFFSSDHHFWHKNVKKFCPDSRMGDTLSEMNDLMISAHNAKVGVHDDVYFLGDFCFGNAEQTRAIIPQLNGNKHLIYGNHDQVIQKNVDIQRMFASVQHYLELRIDGNHIVLFHFPMIEWHQKHHGSYHLYGHVHGSLMQTPNGRSMDVGIDTRTDMAPYSIDEVIATLKPRKT